MDKILLIHPPFGTGNDKRPPDIFDPHFPWGLGYITGILRQNGFDIELFDIYAHQWNRQEALKGLEAKSFNCVMITAMATQYVYIKWLSGELKRINSACTIILGGQLATFSHDVVLKNTLVDICVIGEGELTAVDILNNTNSLDKVNGIAFKGSRAIIKTLPRPIVSDIDRLPNPAYDLFRMDIYKTNKLYVHNKSAALYESRPKPSVMAMISGRGCPFVCNFCSRTFRSIRMRSVGSIIREIDFLRARYGINAINFVDELLFLKQKSIDELALELGKRSLIWNGQARVDTINLDKLKFYKENGLVSIGYGVESGSDEMLKRMNKRITRRKIEKAISMTLEADIHIKLTLIFGYLGENRQSVNETVEMFKGLHHPGRRFCIFTPLPGSQIYNYALEKGIIKNEDAYLSQICEGYWRRVVNMTDLSDDEFDAVRMGAEERMKNNYKDYVTSLPGRAREDHFRLCEEDFEKSFLNNVSFKNKEI
ncbi:MAG: radical SAM protein [Candidatus Omnitrophota bacterium]|jgi:radical SAM superfamily enzyme YgiQ (UPF0313 family)